MTVAAEKYATLVKKLLSSTEAKKLTWVWDEILEEIQCQVAGRTISIEESTNAKDEPIVIIRIRDANQNTIERFDDDDLKHIPTVNTGYATYYHLMTALMEMAKRQATGAEQALDEILSNLDD